MVICKAVNVLNEQVTGDGDTQEGPRGTTNTNKDQQVCLSASTLTHSLNKKLTDTQ